MNRLVTRDEILDTPIYSAQRNDRRAVIFPAKELRRIHVGSYLTFLFENHDTILYQIQEMLRIEGTTVEAEIQHELKTYNELLGQPGDLGCTLLIEIDDPLKRDLVLRKWLHLPKHIYALTADGEKVRAVYDERQVGTDRVSAVQYMTFPVRGRTPVALGLDAPDLDFEQPLSDASRAAFTEDLARS
ncbi:MAG: hypothetical protein ACI9WU_005387 [Myxococcota bacterium]|jgi:hypothetical protein